MQLKIGKEFEWHFPQGDMQMVKCLISFAIIEMQIKPTNYYLTPPEQQWQKRQTVTSVDKEVESLEPSYTIDRNVKH